MNILLISGSLPAGSTNTALLRTAQAVASGGTKAVLYEGMNGLPHFNPDDDHDPLHPAVADLRANIKAADALLFSTPEYAGDLPGSFKNLLDWTVGGGEISQKPVAWVNVFSVASPKGGADVHESLRGVLGYVGAEIVEAACLRMPLTRDLIGADGLIAAAEVRRQIAGVLEALTQHVQNAYPENAAGE